MTWQVLTAAPHRMLFLGGMLQIVLAVLWWTLMLGSRLGADAFLPLPSVSPTGMHGFLMVYGIFPFFIFGFLFTVYPRWCGKAPIPRLTYVSVFLVLLLGIVLVFVGLHAAVPILLAGAALYLAGFARASVALVRVAGRDRFRDPHLRLLNLALVAGALGMGAHIVSVFTGSPFLNAVARETGLWLFLLPVVFTVSHRMIPVFSQGALMNYSIVRPAWGLPLVIVCTATHAALELAGLPQWRFLADAPLAVAALHHSWVWQFRRSFHARLLAMLHIAFLWLGIAMTLYALQSLVLLITGTDPFGRAPLHALGIGFLTGMVIAMASRVSLGHSGRALLADTLTWAALVGVNGVALVRMAAEFWPSANATLNLGAALLWLAFVGTWALRYAPMYLRPRRDGQPG